MARTGMTELSLKNAINKNISVKKHVISIPPTFITIVILKIGTYSHKIELQKSPQLGFNQIHRSLMICFSNDLSVL